MNATRHLDGCSDRKCIIERTERRERNGRKWTNRINQTEIKVQCVASFDQIMNLYIVCLKEIIAFWKLLKKPGLKIQVNMLNDKMYQYFLSFKQFMD